jgi:predicted aldo/keto reductase-like oxidoreductase
MLGKSFCRGCGYCLPCPEGIHIPTVTFLEIWSMQMPRDQIVNPDNDKAVELARGCSECRQCVERCPYDLEIPDMLKENIRFYETFAKT